MRFHLNVYLLSFSAFFADLGYQIVIGGLSVFLVLVLGGPVWFFALIEALSYGVGALFSYVGAKLSDSHSPKGLSIAGNSLIPLLSFTGLVGSYIAAGALYVSGWWSRNFRTAPRRVLMVNATTTAERSRAFGLLHWLDVGGGMIAATILVVLYSAGYSLGLIFLVSLPPLVISTIFLAATRQERIEDEQANNKKTREKGTFTAIMVATALFGFSYYSIGFPILSAAQHTGSVLSGLILYPIFMASSASGGFIYSRLRIKREIVTLGILGYILAGLGTLGISVVLFANLNFAYYYLSIIFLGLGTSAIETFEPSVISKIGGSRVGSGMGILSSFRSIGMFSGNIMVGILYTISASYSYLYAGSVALIGGFLILGAVVKR